MVNSLSLISFFILMNQLIPAHVMIVLEMFYEAATFDLLPIQYIMDPIQQALEPSEMSDKRSFHHNQ